VTGINLLLCAAVGVVTSADRESMMALLPWRKRSGTASDEGAGGDDGD
jgi:hypothetical protein